MIAENLDNLHKKIDQICRRTGRLQKDIQLIAVSKTFPSVMIEQALRCGQLDFGENYVQELQGKRQVFAAEPIRWHYIGHLQRNKVKYIAEYIHLIHSVDDFELGLEIDKRAERCGRIQQVLVELHTTSESSKYGVQPEKALELVTKLSRLPHLRVQGLMTMGPFAEDPEASRASFKLAGEVKREIEAAGIENVSMNQFSMGMTHDYEVAIEEGATLIRIGTAIFGSREKKE